MGFKDILREIFGLDFPIWSHGLECEICRMTFFTASNHSDYVKNNNTLHKHEGKIPVLRGK